LDTIANKRPEIKKVLDAALDNDEATWETIPDTVLNDIDRSLFAASKNMQDMGSKLKKEKEDGYNRGRAAGVESVEQSFKVKEDNLTAAIAALRSQLESAKSCIKSLQDESSGVAETILPP
jgi:hypothetical protein